MKLVLSVCRVTAVSTLSFHNIPTGPANQGLGNSDLLLNEEIAIPIWFGITSRMEVGTVSFMLLWMHILFGKINYKL